MGERWNSGQGGYTCDTCSILLWGGFDGKGKPQYRRWWYSSIPQTVIEFGNLAFCSQDCSRGFLLYVLVKLDIISEKDKASFIKKNTRGTDANHNY